MRRSKRKEKNRGKKDIERELLLDDNSIVWMIFDLYSVTMRSDVM